MNWRVPYWFLVATVAGWYLIVMAWSTVTGPGDLPAADWIESLALSDTFPMIVATGSGMLLIFAVLLYREFGKLADPMPHLHEMARYRGIPAAMESAMRSHSGGGPVTVLVVDDTASNLMVAQELLRSENIPCDTATSGEEAIEKVTENDYALIFLDHVMPGLSGIETARRIRAMPGDKGRTPIIALTANARAEDRVHYFQAGMDDVLAKPLERERLRVILTTWLSRGTSDG